MKRFSPGANEGDSSQLLRKHALFQKMLTPEVAKNIVMSFPVTGSNVQKMAHMEKVYMKDFGRMEQLAIEYLKDIIKASDVANSVKISLGDNLPVKMEFVAPNTKLCFLLAPRIESD